LHKAFLRYHDANNWPMLRAALKRMGRSDLIGSGKHQLIPAYQPAGTGLSHEGRRGHFATQHTGLPRTPKSPRHSGSEPKPKPKTRTSQSPKARQGKGRPHAHINPGSPTGAGKRRGSR
ncbi:MAG TPA: YgiQ family radical SAM protein, partial [Gammaproteobacteria bacterium]|nr:YgiQ family radical SAM protein [Gammaproteobacteria bacterium]